MIVIDTNIIAYLFIQGDRTDKAQHSIKLVTEDAKLIRAFPACALNMADHIAQYT